MRLVKYAMIFGIAIIFPAMVFYGSSIIIEAPDRSDYHVDYSEAESPSLRTTMSTDKQESQIVDDHPDA